VRVVPDLADLSFDIEVRNVDLTAARKEQAARARKVLATLRAAGVAEADLQSSQVQITPNYGDPQAQIEGVRFYIISQSIICTLHDVKKVPDVTAEAVAAGVTGVRDVGLRTSQLHQFRDEARAKAVRAAREKAVALADAFGAKVGRPYNISEAPDFPVGGLFLNNTKVQNEMPATAVPPSNRNAGAAGDGTTPAFAPGTISITASVSVSFLLE
jgi:hypothetical protein